MSTMFEPEQDSPGIMGSVRRLGNSLIGLLHARAELFAVELQEEKIRATRLIVWVAVAAALGAAGILVAIAALAVWLWTWAGYWGLGGLAVLALGLAAVILWRIHRQILYGPAPFAATVAEFKKDAAALGEQK